MGLFIGSLIGQGTNPFFEEWKTPFQVPPFENIKNEHYMPAFLEGMKQHQAEIDAIVARQDAPTFENTLVVLDKSGELLDRVSSVFYGINGANTNKEMQEIARQLSPLMTKHSDDINLNPGLFKKIKAIYEQKDNLKLDPDQKRLLTETFKGFVRGGANLEPAQQEKLRELNKQISMLQLTFGQNLLAETNAYKLVIDKPQEMSGLPQGAIAAATEAGNSDPATKGKLVITLQNPSVMPFLQFSDNRTLREQIFSAYTNRGNNNNDKDNKTIIEKLIPLRLEKAKLMGFATWADFALDNRMAKKPENVYKLLEQVWTPALAKAREEADDMQKVIINDGATFQLEGWDWRYYNEKVMKQRFDLDEETLKPYFKLENVRDGIFYVTNKLYGITFTEVKDAPKYYPDVKLYECKEADGKHLGVLYLDFHPRASKRGGAWCGSYRSQTYKDGKRVAPVMTIVCNFSSPTADKPALLTPDEAETFFHEFGHALNGLLKNVKYQGISGVPRDFVELPSQIMEHWTFEPEVLKVYAKHYITGNVIPQNLVDKIVKSGKYGQGFKTTEYVAACFLDMDYHTMKDLTNLDVLKFESSSMNRIGLIPQIPPRYRSTYFQHIMTGGYTAGYYSYIWAEVLDADAFQAFKKSGDIFDKTTASKFRTCILEKGGSKEAMEMYVDFRGHEPTIDALLENRGLK
ncbi:MAG: M3 family metallopeptidase [Bacteroidota bacterium]